MSEQRSAFTRCASLAGTHFSTVIVGAGINGAGVFRDLSLQGVHCLIVDKGDFAAGASSAPSRPSLTQDACTFGTSGCSTSRATACIRIASRKLGPERARPRRHNGASMCTNGSGTNSVNPCVRACRSRTASRWRAQCTGRST